MTSKKYPVEKVTKEKIKKLFAYRRIMDLLKETGLSNDQAFVNQLVDVQYQIYMLDAYLEGQWEIHKSELAVYWKAIEHSLTQMGYKKKKIASLVTEIEEYQQIEVNCRKEKWPTKVPFRKFYSTKSCDVRLIRHLIYVAHPGLEQIWKESSWIHYDLITEIHDDVADLEEDIKTYNGNRFLISILRKGAEKTQTEYEKKLRSITEKANKHFENKKGSGKNKQLAAWITTRSKQTINLLNSKMNSMVMDKLSQSFLLHHMS